MASIITTRYGYNVGGAERRQPVDVTLVVSELALDPAILYVAFESRRRRAAPAGQNARPAQRVRVAMGVK